MEIIISSDKIHLLPDNVSDVETYTLKRLRDNLGISYLSISGFDLYSTLGSFLIPDVHFNVSDTVELSGRTLGKLSKICGLLMNQPVTVEILNDSVKVHSLEFKNIKA